MIRVGLIGCGFMGGMHVACYAALAELGVKVTAIADDRPEFLAQMKEQTDAQTYESGMALIEQADVDVVDICLPTYLHTAHACAAMEKGRDVFCEKPVCLTEEDMQALLETKKRTGRKVMVGQVIRLWDEYAWLKKTVDAGTYGRVLSGVFQRVSSRPGWASRNWLHTSAQSGGVAVDMHVHDVDFVRYLLGEPDRIQAGGYRDSDGLIEQIFAIYNYGRDVAVSVEAAWDYPASFPFSATFRVKLEKATITNDANGLTVYPNDGDAFHPELAAQYTGDNRIGGNISSLGGYYNELKYFVEGLQGKNDLSVAPLEEAIASVRLVKKEIEAAGGLLA